MSAWATVGASSAGIVMIAWAAFGDTALFTNRRTLWVIAAYAVFQTAMWWYLFQRVICCGLE